MNTIILAQSDRFQALDAKTQHIVKALLDREDTSNAQTMLITQLLGRVELIAEDQRLTARALREIRTAIQKQKVPGGENGISASYKYTPNLGRLREELGLTEDHIRLQISRKICDDLRYSTMMDREEAISDAHQKTFSWILDEGTGSQISWSSFTDWLHKGEGLYWVNGKAASGKSTLMKYIHESPKTKQLLREWATGRPLATARFYFWISGTAEQRSQTGLLRSLLFEILTQNLNLIPIVLPVRWAERYSELIEPFMYRETSSINLDQWTMSELMEAFENLLAQKTLQLSLCLFIDGLDEFEGDYASITGLLHRISKLPWLKVCVSSRPLLDFEDSFRSVPSLRLQDLTHSDITTYVASHFNNNEHFHRLAKEEPTTTPQLIESVVARADGVFLWVKLVVRSLLEGLKNRDELADLQRRLELIPTDLEDLFKSMLSKITPFYRNKAAEIFQIIRASYRITENWDGDSDLLLQLDTLTLAFAIDTEPYLNLERKLKSMSKYEKDAKRERIRDQLKVWCAGLLETGTTNRSQEAVQYLHRTVRDYLDRPENLKVLIGPGAKTDFEPSTELLKSTVIQIQPDDSLGKLTVTALMYAHQADVEAKRANTELLNHLDRNMTVFVRKKASLDFDGHGHWATRLGAPMTEDTFLPIAVVWDLVSYVESYFTDPRSKWAGKKGKPLLDYLLEYTPPAQAGTAHLRKRGAREFDHPAYRYSPSPRMTILLLQHGCDPCESFQGKSAWVTAVDSTVKLCKVERRHGWTDRDRRLLLTQLEIISLMLDHGANASLCLLQENLGDKRWYTARRLLTEELMNKWPEKASEVDKIFAKHGGKFELSLYQKLKSQKSKKDYF
jgi:NACHT domain